MSTRRSTVLAGVMGLVACADAAVTTPGSGADDAPATATTAWQVSSGTAGLNMQSLWNRGSITYAGGATGVYRSDDAGATFRASNNGNDAVGPTRAFAHDIAYLYSSASQGVYRSADLGSTWTVQAAGLTEVRTSGLLKVGTRLYVVGPSGVFRSDNQGGIWVAAGLVGTDVRAIAAIGDLIFVGTNGQGMMKSADFGTSWTPINSGLTTSTVRAVEAKGTTLFVGGEIGTGVFRSTNAGATWTLLSGGLPPSSYRGFASNDQLIVAGAFGGGVFYSKNNGDSWTELNTGLSDKTVFDLAIGDTTLFAATSGGGVFRIPISALR